jgi:hypothetical protein
MGTCLNSTEGPEGSRASWSRTSGEALRRNQCFPSTLIAAEDWVRCLADEGSRRATRHEGHQQFHWGKPPPAAVPRRITCTYEKEAEQHGSASLQDS